MEKCNDVTAKKCSERTQAPVVREYEIAGTVAKILTNSANHPHGIKVMLDDGQVGRVQEIVVSKELRI